MSARTWRGVLARIARPALPNGRAAQTIPRSSLIWLLAAQLLVIVPHLGHVPAWIVPLWLGCAVWRLQILRQRAAYPNGWIKAGLLLITAAGVWFSRGSLVGLDAGVLLLIVVFVLKLLEMRTRRDALVLILLGFFVVVTAYLFDDSLLMALFSLLPVTLLLAALIGLQHCGLAAQPWPPLRLAGALLLQAVPLMLLLFVFFPRISPLWSLPIATAKAVSGLSDSMAPGDIAELSQSAEPVFRARFEGPLPPRSSLYWRALSLDHFDGRRWSQSDVAPSARAPAWEKRGEPIRYEVLMQPSVRPWLFGLDVAQTDLQQTRQMSDFRLQRQRPVERALLYRVQSWPQALREPQAAPSVLRRNLQLPSQGNPRSRAWAAQLQRQHPQSDALVDALLQHFNRQPFVYTLQPPVLGADSIDAFLFDTRRGFCAHYAGAMTFVLRAAGIPARVVAGYQGGELHDADNYVQVRQFDAHAWVEYWRPGQGWSSVDPTFEVAPQRIELGLEQALAQDQGFLQDSPLLPLRTRHMGWQYQVGLNWDNLNDGWQRWVLGYHAQQQVGLLQRWFGELDGRVLAIALVGGGGLSLGLLALVLFKPWRREPDVPRRLFHGFERVLARQGVRRETGEGARAFALRAALRLPAQAASIQAFATAFEAHRYAGRPASTAQLRQLLRQLRRELPWHPWLKA